MPQPWQTRVPVPAAEFQSLALANLWARQRVLSHFNEFCSGTYFDAILASKGYYQIVPKAKEQKGLQIKLTQTTRFSK